MSSEHKTYRQILSEIEKAKAEIEIGAVYAHYKNPSNTYEVLGFGTFEATDELCVMYKSNYGERLTFIRPVDIWLENVEWNGKLVPRFKKL